jgi:hypothetical protein
MAGAQAKDGDGDLNAAIVKIASVPAFWHLIFVPLLI